MLSSFRIFEIILFSLVNFGPYVALSLYTFSNHLRFSKIKTGILCLFLLVFQFGTRYWCASNDIDSSIVTSILRLILFVGIYTVMFDIRFGKVLFLELIFADIGNFIIIAAVCIERNIFPANNHHLYCWHASVAMLLLHLIITTPFAYAIHKYLKPMMENKSVGREWYYYWIVPAIFYLIWQYQINGGTETGLENIQNPYNVVFLFVINIGSFLIYYIIILLDSQLVKNLELEHKNHYLDIEKLEYQALHDRMEETRRARHDLRHHILTLSDYLEAEEYERLKEYLDSYKKSMPDMQTYLFCQNRAVNRLLLFFATQAREHDIDFQVKLSVPEEIGVSETDISVLLGNLLENALEACVEQQNSKRKIIISGKGDKNSLVFTIDNTCENEIKKARNGEFLTTKPNGSGIGLQSVKHIVGRYNGVFSAEKKGEMFYVSFMLNL